METAEQRKARIKRVTNRRKANAEAGLCSCGRERMAGIKSCAACRDSHSRYQRKRYMRMAKSKRALGLCCNNGCYDTAAEGRTRCGYHLEMNSEANQKKEKNNEAKGKCKCGKARTKGFKACAQCREKRSATQRLARSEKRCILRMATR